MPVIWKTFYFRKGTLAMGSFLLDRLVINRIQAEGTIVRGDIVENVREVVLM